MLISGITKFRKEPKKIPGCGKRAKHELKRQVGVLGLAPCHVSENEIIGLQVRPAGQAGYPISPVASLDTVAVKCCPRASTDNTRR